MKQINLSDSKIVGVHIVVNSSDKITSIVVEGRVFDDSGAQITGDNTVLPWGSMSVQSRQTVNKLMKVLSKEYNRINVNDDTETWEDS